MAITVNVGEILECDDKNEIRTRGCDPCVALIAIYEDEKLITKRCAHFCVNMAGSLNQNRIDNALKPILEKHFKLDKLKAVGFTTGGEDYKLEKRQFSMGSKEIFLGLQKYFPGDKTVVKSSDCDSLTTAELGVKAVKLDKKTAENWKFTNNPAKNQDADLK